MDLRDTHKVLTQIYNGNKKIETFSQKEKKRKDPIFSLCGSSIAKNNNILILPLVTSIFSMYIDHFDTKAKSYE